MIIKKKILLNSCHAAKRLSGLPEEQSHDSGDVCVNEAEGLDLLGPRKGALSSCDVLRKKKKSITNRGMIA